jgi:hypothetical protein
VRRHDLTPVTRLGTEVFADGGGPCSDLVPVAGATLAQPLAVIIDLDDQPNRP